MKAMKVVNDPEEFQLLADGTRRKIIFLLRATEMTVSQIASTLGVTPQAIYHHIKKLQNADLVIVEREERVGHLIESYYRATAEAFLCSVGVTPSGREFFEKQTKTTLDALVKIGFKLEYDEDDIQSLIEKQDELLKCCSEKDFEENLTDTLDDLDNNTLAFVKDFGKLLAMTDEEFEKHQQLNREFRDALKSLEK
ncbi:winged helix-turn-helix transcriptional regulator [Candidatus Bathyarchaeota archaeon]|nr:winged helix-turn-helix transcriptional regulator [Candidatus Bathyarchaeota archaeon]MBL7078869.1 winged helix-turn-helix transcriptional regulator [Candidatus Bathyarchaeota archaeon]